MRSGRRSIHLQIDSEKALLMTSISKRSSTIDRPTYGSVSPFSHSRIHPLDSLTASKPIEVASNQILQHTNSWRKSSNSYIDNQELSIDVRDMSDHDSEPFIDRENVGEINKYSADNIHRSFYSGLSKATEEARKLSDARTAALRKNHHESSRR